MDNVLSDNSFYSPTSWTIVPNPAVGPPPGRWEGAHDHITDNDYGPGYVFALGIWCGRCQNLTFEMITLEWRCNSITYFTQKIYAFGVTDALKRQNDKTPQQNKKKRTVPDWWSCRQISRLEQVLLSHRFVFSSFVVLRLRQNSQVNLNFLNIKRDRPRLRRSPWWLGRPTWVRDPGPTR